MKALGILVAWAKTQTTLCSPAVNGNCRQVRARGGGEGTLWLYNTALGLRPSAETEHSVGAQSVRSAGCGESAHCC